MLRNAAQMLRNAAQCCADCPIIMRIPRGYKKNVYCVESLQFFRLGGNFSV